jgi:hypothetical protein
MSFPSFATGEVLTAADMNAVGLWKVGDATATAQNRLNIPSCFSADYSAYRVVVTPITHSTAGNLIMRLSSNGTDTSGASTSYTSRRNETDATLNSVVSFGATSFFSPTFVNNTANSFASISFDIINPFATTYTYVSGMSTRIDGGSNVIMVSFAGTLIDTTSYNGFSLVGNTGNITCRVRVYGYRN